MAVHRTPLIAVIITLSASLIAAEDGAPPKHPMLGITPRGVEPHILRIATGDDDVRPPVIGFIDAGTTADEMGLKVGDKITEIDNNPIKYFPDIPPRVAAHQVGDKILIKVLREDKEIELTGTLKAREDFKPKPYQGGW
jgi:S1-C subfamily serine protease